MANGSDEVKMIQLIIRHAVSLNQAVCMAARFVRTLSVPASGIFRYFRKSINLSLAYVGFCSDDSIRQSRLVGKAAFLCCAYDVCTDWHGDPSKWRDVFIEILRASDVSEDLSQIAIRLYDLDISGRIPVAGLGRGAVSVEFITKMAGSFDVLNKQIDLHEFGIACQVADDLLDVVQDHAEEALNFVGMPGWKHRVFQARQVLSSDAANKLYRRGPILRLALNKGLAKADAKSTLAIASSVAAATSDFAK